MSNLNKTLLMPMVDPFILCADFKNKLLLKTSFVQSNLVSRVCCQPLSLGSVRFISSSYFYLRLIG